MATIDDFNTAIANLGAAVDQVIAKATEAAQVVPDFTEQVAAVDALTQKLEGFLTPAA